MYSKDICGNSYINKGGKFILAHRTVFRQNKLEKKRYNLLGYTASDVVENTIIRNTINENCRLYRITHKCVLIKQVLQVSIF